MGGGAMWSAGFLEASLMLLLCGCLSVMWLQHRVHVKMKKFPPGPMALPIIGHLYLLINLPHQALAKLSSKYGDMMGLKLGQQRCVVVSSPELAKEFLVTHDKTFANRPPYGFISILLYGQQNDIFFNSYGERWRNHRKICTLDLFTPKRLQQLEYVRQEELGALLQRIAHRSSGGTTAVNIGTCIGEMSTNVISRLLYSRKGASECQDEGGEKLPQLVKEIEQETVPSIGDFIPWLSWLDLLREPRLRHVHRRIDAVITGILTERKQAMMQNCDPPDDLLQTLLTKEMAKSTGDEDGFTMIEVKSIMLDMLAGSVHTTALVLEWAMAELLKNPHCLAKLQREMYTVLGKKEQITDADVSQLSYLRCVVKEVFRLHPVIPLLLPRFSTEECKVRSYTLPANTHLLVNVWAIGRDEQVWENARHFRPQRFEGKATDIKGQHFELLPFGAGRRTCVGIPLALSIVEVTLASLVNRFNWELPPGVTPATLNLDEKRGIAANKAVPMLAIPKLRL